MGLILFGKVSEGRENERGRRTLGEKRILLMKISAAMLAVSLTAKYAAGYIMRSLHRAGRGKRDLSVDVIAPKYGPALVVSTEEFEDEFDQIVTDGFHTQTFLRVTRLEILRKTAIAVSAAAMVVTFLLWLFGPEEE